MMPVRLVAVADAPVKEVISGNEDPDCSVRAQTSFFLPVWQLSST